MRPPEPQQLVLNFLATFLAVTLLNNNRRFHMHVAIYTAFHYIRPFQCHLYTAIELFPCAPPVGGWGVRRGLRRLCFAHTVLKFGFKLLITPVFREEKRAQCQCTNVSWQVE